MRVVKAWAGIGVPRFMPVVITAALVVSGCSIFGGSAPGSGGSGGGQLTVGIVPGIDNTPLRVGLQDGLFRDHGLNVVIKSFSSLQPEFQALKNGSVDVAAGDYADFLYEAAAGSTPLRLLADGYDAAPSVMEVLAMPGSGITTPQQLAHKVVATPEPGLIPSSSGSYTSDFVPFSMETLATESVLVSDGVTPTSVTWKPTPAQDMVRALRRGQVNAILATEPTIVEAESKLGAVEVMDSCSGLTANLPLSGYFSLGSYAGTHASQVQQFQAALASAQANAADRGVLQDMLPHFTGMSTQDADLATLGSFPTSLIIPQIQRVADLMYRSGVISNPLQVSSLASRLTSG